MRQLRKKEIKKEFSKLYKRDKEIVLILENIQYARNVASMFRTADAAGVKRIYLTGISHHPPFGKELRQVSRSKEQSVEWIQKESSIEVINSLQKQGFEILPIELTDKSILVSDLADYLKDKDKICFIGGSEVYGINRATLAKCENSVVIPMYGKGASINVSNAVTVVLFSF
ncbi:MAG: TrmH family RNA methyltransferase [Candidatus Dojkabacteria bacterium]